MSNGPKRVMKTIAALLVGILIFYLGAWVANCTRDYYSKGSVATTRLTTFEQLNLALNSATNDLRICEGSRHEYMLAWERMKGRYDALVEVNTLLSNQVSSCESDKRMILRSWAQLDERLTAEGDVSRGLSNRLAACQAEKLELLVELRVREHAIQTLRERK